MEHERLIKIAARLLIEKHGERAQCVAAQRAREWIERQDGAAALLWVSIRDAVQELETGALDSAPLFLERVVRRMMTADDVEDDEVTRLLEQVKK